MTRGRGSNPRGRVQWVQPGLIGYFVEPNWERAAAIASAEVIALLIIAFPAAAPALIPSLVP